MRKKLVLLVVLSLVALFLASGIVIAAPAGKVEVCHSEGNGSYHLISVSDNAYDSHVAHGDASPGDPVQGMEGKKFDEACNVVDDVAPIYVLSAQLNYNGSGGWAGWSCPAGTTVVDGGFLPATADVANSLAWKPGASVGAFNYPTTPFGYTYTPPEEGWIVQDGGTPNVPTHIYLWCLPTSP